jgi:hypothetical protein
VCLVLEKLADEFVDRDRRDACPLRRGFETEIDRLDAVAVLSDRKRGELDGHAQLHVIGVRFDVDDVGSYTGSIAIDDRRNEWDIDTRGREGHDGVGTDFALGCDSDLVELGSRALAAGIASVEEARTASGALIGFEVGVVAEYQVIDEGDLFGHDFSYSRPVHALLHVQACAGYTIDFVTSATSAKMSATRAEHC